MSRAASPVPTSLPTVAHERVWRWPEDTPGRGRARSVPDALAVEEPLELRVDSRSIAVVMRTPGHDEELVAGFLLTEGVVRSAADLAAIRRHPRNRDGNVIDVFLGPRVRVDFGRLTRHVFAASSCGLCGKATLDAVRRQFPRPAGRLRMEPAILRSLPGRMRAAQTEFAAHGGTHAAALFSADGELLVLREDVGRHNAVDKILGRALLDGRLPLSDRVLLVSGRASFEIVQKALAGGVPLVAAVSAPSSMAVRLARSSGQTLVGFLRDARFNVYSRPGRIARGRGRG